MPKKKEPELTDQERAKRIKEVAREVEADENAKAFERFMRKVSPSARRPSVCQKSRSS
jgi:hypothetical protein